MVSKVVILGFMEKVEGIIQVYSASRAGVIMLTNI